MAFVFDHLISFLVGATLLGALLVVQLRQQQQSVDTLQRDNVQMQTADFLASLQRDVENIRTRAQTNAAFGGNSYRFTLLRATGTDNETYTRQLTFPTLKDPSLGAASPVVIVTYALEPTGDSIRAGSVWRPTYRATRYEYARGGSEEVTGGGENLVDLDVMFVPSTGAEIAQGGGVYAGGVIDPSREIGYHNDTPVRAKIAAVASAAPLARRTSDQQAAGTTSLTRHADTVRILGATATGGLPIPEAGLGGIPPLTADVPPPPPPPPTPPPPTPEPPPVVIETPTPAGPITPRPPPPPPTPRPTPPPGAQI